MRLRYHGYAVLFVLLSTAFITRWFFLNKDVQGSKIEIISGDQVVKTNGLRVAFEGSELYEMPAFVEHYPETEEFYAMATNRYVKMGMEEGYKTLKYVAAVNLKFTNISEDVREIFYTDYELTCENQTVVQGVYPEMTQVLNNDQISCRLKPGESKSVLFNYDLYGINIKELTYEKLKKLRLVVLVSGYPDMKAFELQSDSLVCSTGAFDPYKAEVETGVVTGESVPEDSRSGDVLSPGEEIVQNGVGFRVESMEIVKNLKDYEGYDPSAWLSYYRDSFVNEDGTFETIAESGQGLPDDYYTAGYKDYAVFVTLKIHNYTSTQQSVYNGFGLFNSDNSLEGPSAAEYTAAWESVQEKDINRGIIGGGCDQLLVLGYTRSIKNDQNMDHLHLYISNDYDIGASEFDLDAGKGGFGVYLRIQ